MHNLGVQSRIAAFEKENKDLVQLCEEVMQKIERLGQKQPQPAQH